MRRARTMSGLRASGVGALAILALAAAAPIDLPVASKSPVADAAMRGDRETVRELLRDGVDVNAAQGDGMTALHWGAMKGDVEMAEMLLYAGANVKATTRLGAYTPLFLAAKAGSGAMVETLLDAGADPNASTTNGTTPLMMAAASGSADAATALLDQGANLDTRDAAMGRTALMFAAAYGHSAIVDLLAERGADVAVTTNVVDVAEVAEAHRKAYREKVQRQRKEAEKAARAAQGQQEGSKGARAEDENEDGEGREPKKGESGNVFAKLFGWILPGGGEKKNEEKGPEPLSYGDLVGAKGGLTALLFAARQGHLETVKHLLEAGAEVNQRSEGDRTTPLLIATINGHFDLAMYLLEQGADPNLASDAGARPLYAAINVQWAPKALYPQPRAYLQQRSTYLDVMKALLDAGADPNVRLKRKLWYSSYNFDLTGVDDAGATPFWRAAYATDVEAMRLLVKYGADPNIPTIKMPERRFGRDDDEEDQSGLPPVPYGGPAVYPIHAASGVGYGKGFAANSHRHVPNGWLPAVKYLVEEIGADVNARDHEGYTALHHAASRGDNELIEYLVSKGADVTVVSRAGQTTADMANGPVQRVQPFPETVALLEKLGSKNNHNCVSC